MTAKNTQTKFNQCSCGTALSYENCCGVYHLNQAAPTPEALMRSRYSAYVLGLSDYLSATWHESTRPSDLDLTEDTAVKWLGLKVNYANASGEQGEVHFVARYKIAGKAYRLEEKSRFVLENGRWFYLDGEVAQ